MRRITKITFLLLIALFLLITRDAYTLNLARVKTWSAGEILTAADLNAEYNNILNHSITNNDISASAAIAGTKLDLTSVGVIGNVSSANITATNLTATGNISLGNGADALTINCSLGTTWPLASNWTFTGNQTVIGWWADLGNVTTVNIDGGSLDNTTLGASVGTTANVTTLTTNGKLTAGANEIEGSNFDITGGTMSGVNIGGTTATGELIVNDASDDADGLGSQGTAGQYLRSQGAGVNPIWGNVSGNSNVIFSWSGVNNYLANNYGLYVGTTIEPDISATDTTMMFLATTNTTSATLLNFKWVKIPDVSTVTVNALLRVSGGTVTLTADIGGANTTLTATNQGSSAWATPSTIDVSSLTNGTTYDGIIQLKISNAANDGYCHAVTLTGS